MSISSLQSETCEQQRYTMLYLLRLLRDEEEAAARVHIEGCAACQALREECGNLRVDLAVASAQAQRLATLALDDLGPECRAQIRSVARDEPAQAVDEEHMEDCWLCSYLVLYAALRRRLAMGSTSPVDKLLYAATASHTKAALGRVTQEDTMDAERMLQLCEEAIQDPGLARALTLDGDLVAAWRGALAHPPDLRLEALRKATEQYDRAYMPAAGDEDLPPVESTPWWFTHLLEPPATLSWKPTEAGDQWHVRVWAGGRDLVDQRVTSPEVALPRDQIPVGAIVRWQVQALSEDLVASPLVRGAFRLLTPDEARAVLEGMRQLSAGDGRLPEQADIRRARHFQEAQLLEALIGHWIVVRGDGTDLWRAFVAERGLQAAYSGMYVQLTKLRMGSPEGLWAASLAEQSGNKALMLLGGLPS